MNCPNCDVPMIPQSTYGSPYEKPYEECPICHHRRRL
jgi:hypothetical protein